MKPLADYLSEHRISRQDFARTIGVDQSMLSRLCNDRAKPSLATAVAIERATGGAVPATSWIADDRENAA